MFRLDAERIGTSSLLDLPTELLAEIAGFLPAVDRIAFSETCHRIQDVCCTKSVVQHLDYTRCYRLSDSALKRFMAGRQLCENVRVLNLNHCYWLRSNVLLRFIPHLRNLEELHLLECPVSTSQLIRLLSGLKHLIALSFTTSKFKLLREHLPNWKELVNGKLSGLKALTISVYDFLELRLSLNYAAACRNLESFELSLQGTKDGVSLAANDAILYLQENGIVLETALQPPYLKTIKIELLYRHNDSYLEFMREFVSSETRWNKFWISGGCHILEGDWMRAGGVGVTKFDNCTALNLGGLFGERCLTLQSTEIIYNIFNEVHEMKCTELSLDYVVITPELLDAIANSCPCLTKLSLRLCTTHGNRSVLESFKELCEKCNRITELYLDSSFISVGNENYCEALYTLKGLRKLTIIPGMLCPLEKGLVEYNRLPRNDFASNRRIGVQTVATENQMAQSRFWMLADKCHRVEHLEISDISLTLFNLPSRNGSRPCLDDVDLACISKWTKLRYLYLAYNEGVQHGNFLAAILRDCPELTTLKLCEIGKGGACVYLRPLAEGLRHASHLKDLSITNDNIDLTVSFLEGLLHCVELERLCIRKLASLSDQLIVSIVNTLRKLPKLVFVYMCVEGTAKACHRLEVQILGSRSQRPQAFRCFIDRSQENDNRLSKCPIDHQSIFYHYME